MQRIRTSPQAPVHAPARRGSILIIVLITLLAASLALTLFIEKASDDLLVEARDIDARRLRAEAYSSLEVTLCVLNEFRQVNGGLRSPAEGWGDPLVFAAYEPGQDRTVQVEFVDESGKLSLPRQTPAALVDLFKSWELSQADSEKLADALLDWCKADHVSSSGYSNTYEEDVIPFGSPARSLRSWSELASIDLLRDLLFDEEGRPNDRWRQFTDTFSLFDFSATNVNAARPGVLTALGLDTLQQSQLGDYLAGRNSFATAGPGYFRSAADAAKLVSAAGNLSALGAEIRALRIIITVREGRSFFRLNTVVTPKGSAGAKAITAKAKPSNRAGATTGASETATTGTANANAAANSSTRASGSGGGGGTGSTLNYPFTVLEIRENDEIPQAVSSPEAIPSQS